MCYNNQDGGGGVNNSGQMRLVQSLVHGFTASVINQGASFSEALTALRICMETNLKAQWETVASLHGEKKANEFMGLSVALWCKTLLGSLNDNMPEVSHEAGKHFANLSGGPIEFHIDEFNLGDFKDGA